MDINVALDGAKKRDLLFYAGDDLSIVLKVYAHDGDATPIVVTNVRFDAPAGNLPLGSSFTVPYNYIGRSAYRIVGDVAGITTTLAFGVLQTPGGWPSAYCWQEHGTRPDYPWGVVGKAENISVLDAEKNFEAPTNVEKALAELGTFKKQLVGGLDTLIPYDELEAAIVSLGATITDVQASVLEFIAGGGSTGSGTELPSSISALLARVLPEGGTAGQLPYRTTAGPGYAAWGDAPTGGTTTPPPPAPPPPAAEDFTAGTDAMDESAEYMTAETATLE